MGGKGLPVVVTDSFCLLFLPDFVGTVGSSELRLWNRPPNLERTPLDTDPWDLLDS